MNYQYPSLGYDNRPVLAGDRQSKQQPMVNSGYFSFRGAAYPSINNSAYSLVPNYEYGPVAGYPVASGYNVDLQERIARAKDINMRYKQSLARTAVLNHHNEVAQVVLPYKITKPVVEKPSVSKQFEHKQFQHQPYQYKYVQNKKAIDGKVLSELSLKSVAPAEQHRAGAVAFEDDEDIELISNDVPTKKMPPVIKKQEDSQPMDYRPGPKDSQLQHSHNYVDEHLKKSTEASISQPDPKLNELASKISQAVAENKNELDSKAKKNKNKKKLDKTELIAENKKKIDSVMKKNANSVILMPLWRHRRNGIMNPPPDKILKGKRLFRVIVKSLLGMFIRYSVVSYKVKLEMREKERQALTRALNIYSESMDDWLAKLVSMPLSSLQQVICLARRRYLYYVYYMLVGFYTRL